jgi:hypothetical protein
VPDPSFAVQGNTKGVVVRFVLAIIFFVLALGTLGTGIAQRTFLAGPNHVTLHTVSHAAAPVVVIDGAALNSYKQTQNVKLTGSTAAFAAYGRTSDVLAWVGNASYNQVTLDRKTGELQSTLHAGKNNTVPNPAGSDLWLQEFTFDQAKNFSIKIPSDMSVIAVSNGTLPAPSDISVVWPIDHSEPLSGPLILIGAIAMLVGLILLLLAFNHLRRTRGPRRSPQKMPKLPRQRRLKPLRKELTTTKGRRSIRNFAAIVPTIGISALLLAGCTAVPAPSIPTSSATPGAAAATKTPAVTTAQLQLILRRISATVKNADSKFTDRLAGRIRCDPVRQRGGQPAAGEQHVAANGIHRAQVLVEPLIEVHARADIDTQSRSEVDAHLHGTHAHPGQSARELQGELRDDAGAEHQVRGCTGDGGDRAAQPRHRPVQAAAGSGRAGIRRDPGQGHRGVVVQPVRLEG